MKIWRVSHTQGHNLQQPGFGYDLEKSISCDITITWKGCTWCACGMHSNPDSWWTYLTSMFNIEFQTSPYKPLCTYRWRWQKCCRLISRDENAIHPDMILWLHCNRLSACDSVVSCHAGRTKVAGIEFYSASGSSGTNVEVHIESYTPSRV